MASRAVPVPGPMADPGTRAAISGGRSGAVEGELDRASVGKGELDGASGAKGELDRTSVDTR